MDNEKGPTNQELAQLQRELDEEDALLYARIQEKLGIADFLSQKKAKERERERRKEIKIRHVKLFWWENQFKSDVYRDYPTMTSFKPESGFSIGTLNRKYYVSFNGPLSADFTLEEDALSDLMNLSSFDNDDLLFGYVPIKFDRSKISSKRSKKIKHSLGFKRNRYTLGCPRPKAYHGEDHMRVVLANSDYTSPD